MKARMLIVEDDPALGQMLALHFEDEGCEVEVAATCALGLEQVGQGGFDLVLLDQQLPDGTGSDLLVELLAISPHLPVVMMTGQHDLELAIEAIQRGAADFVHKPVQTETLQRTVEGLLEQRRLARETAPRVQTASMPQRDLIGRSSAMLAVSKAIALSARGSTTVLISGESGTGKEVVARLIHQHSGVPGAFVAVNCAAIVDTLLESELFGHERGAFTGAQGKKLGKLELANDGTLFLDEVGELAPAVQAKLLRALQEHSFERVGGTETLTSNARIIAATNRDLMAEVSSGRFREDLAYRLRVVEIGMPPLRDRREDVPLLAEGLLARIAARLDKSAPAISDAALDCLMSYDWPGNVRELENSLTRAMVGARDGVITPDLLELPTTRSSRQGPETVDVEDAVLRSLDDVEAEHIQRVLDHTRAHKARSCEILGISRPALDRKITKYGLNLDRGRH
ncbi:MAG: sigma-54 dependent transcriptional regulator [Thiohalocapsa sp.]